MIYINLDCFNMKLDTWADIVCNNRERERERVDVLWRAGAAPLCTRHPAVAGNSAIVLGVKCQVQASKATAGVVSECSVLYNMVGRAIKAQPSSVKTRP